MPTDVQIASNALILIGHTPIQALSDDERVEALYPTAYLALLTEHAWNFATKKAQFSQLATAPLNQYEYAYQLPSDLLIIDRTYPMTHYEIVGDQLHANSNEIEASYRFKVAEQYLPAYFVQMMEFFLASKFAIPITSNKSTAEEYREAYKDWKRVAKFLDSQRAPQPEPVDQPFVGARFGDR